MKNNHESHTPADLLNDLNHLVAEAEKMIGETITENTADAVGALRGRFEAAHDRLVELGSTAKRKLVAGAQGTDQAIRANPYQSLAVAAGVGLLVGFLLGRRKD